MNINRIKNTYLRRLAIIGLMVYFVLLLLPYAIVLQLCLSMWDGILTIRNDWKEETLPMFALVKEAWKRV